jgi:hypothetical protein
MWEISGKPTDSSWFPSFDPTEVLYEFDGPRVFTIQDADDELNLVYWSDALDTTCRYIIAPTTATIISALRSGNLSVLDALNQPRCWICDTSPEGSIVNCWRLDFEQIPRDCLPALGTMLFPELEPLLTLRAIGDEIRPGQIPGSVIRTCVEGVQKTFKVLSEYVLEKPSQAGRPPEFLRRLFDLPTQRLAFGSFEISFRMPIEERDLFSLNASKSPEAETLEHVGSLLKKGLNWLATSAGEEGLFSPDNPDEGAVVLRALKELTPSSQGSIERLEIKGQLIGPRTTPQVLERSARQRVNTAIRNRSLESKLVDLEGRIRELDKDRLSFELREIGDGSQSMQRFVFDEGLLEEVFQAFQEDRRVQVAGRTFPVKNLAYALAISRSTTDGE